jgi:CDP-diacylglycerol--glycerol-3-phosphate 3-phosphatidyltransferase
VDRYEEFFVFAGLAMFFRSSGLALAATLLALTGAFMVSYANAQAEARQIAVPVGIMRRPERATTLGVGIVLCPIAEAASQSLGATTWVRDVPAILAVAVIAVVGNASAIRRLRATASALASARTPCMVSPYGPLPARASSLAVARSDRGGDIRLRERVRKRHDQRVGP